MRDVRNRFSKGNNDAEGLGKSLETQNLAIETNKKVFQTCIFSTLLYGCEALVVTRAIIEQRIMAFETGTARTHLHNAQQHKD